MVAGRSLHADLVLNRTYAALGSMGLPLRANARKEWAEMALREPPQEFSDCSAFVEGAHAGKIDNVYDIIEHIDRLLRHGDARL